MIGFFPVVYDDELLFSILGRYQYYDEFASPRDVLENVFGTRTLRATIEFPTHLEELSERTAFLNKSKEDYLRAHTIFPMYEPFLLKEDQELLSNWMYQDGGHRVKFKIGYIAGSVKKKESLMYCPECLKDDVKDGHDPYFRTVHQMQGVEVCHKHNVVLEPYPSTKAENSNIRYFHLDAVRVLGVRGNRNGNEVLFNISKAFAEIYSGGLSGLTLFDLKSAYRMKLKEFGFLSVNGSVKYGKFISEMIEFIGIDVLKELDSEILVDDEFNWVKNLLRSKSRKVHPLRHLLFILYFFGSIEAVAKYATTGSKETRYPCMNPVCTHYRRLWIFDKHIEITPDYKTREPVVTIKCPHCGFAYSRKMADDMYKVGRIKAFGDLWFEELKKQALDNSLSIRAKAMHMGCDPGTLKKYLGKINLN